jgi:hypothetical protein
MVIAVMRFVRLARLIGSRRRGLLIGGRLLVVSLLLVAVRVASAQHKRGG